tara:strand:+ start:77 stop:412 length:336 start_codon:yes stop_codon:yes gene_type:complete
VTHKERISAIKRLVEVPKKATKTFWGCESKCLSVLIQEFPNEDFWLKISFSIKFDSLKMLRSGYYHDELKKRYGRFNYSPPEDSSPKVSSHKSGEDYLPKSKPKSIREFLK